MFDTEHVMQKPTSNDIHFDPERNLIVGLDFSIAHVGRQSRDPCDDIFLYSSDHALFYFIAERYVNTRPDLEDVRFLVDTKIYTIKKLGYPYSKDPKYLRTEQITEHQKQLVMPRIESALYFDQSPFYQEPPQEVRFGLR